jgi:hypothetical protein
MNDILKAIHDEIKKNIYNNIDEYFNLKGSFGFYETYNENEKVRMLVSDIENIIKKDITSSKNCILNGTISCIEKSLSQMKKFIIANPSKKESIQKVFLNSIIGSVSYLDNVNMNQDFFNKLLKSISNNELKNFILTIVITHNDIVNYYNRNLLGIYEETGLKNLEYINKSNLYLISLTECLLNQYEEQLCQFNGDIKNILCQDLEKLYKTKNYDLKTESQWSKYKLIELNEHRYIAPMAIVDTKYNISFFPHLISSNVLEFIKDYYQKFQFKLSLYPNCSTLFNFDFDYSLVLEDIQYGIAPSIERLKSKLSNYQIKLIDINLQDSFWVWNKSTDLYLEEIVNDFNIYQESIVTRMIHIEFFKEENILYIKHIDFEYIFYSEEEFISREKNINQKGKKYMRQKIFKIDNAKIPLDNLFLYYISYNIFTNTILVNEAFEALGIIKNTDKNFLN